MELATEPELYCPSISNAGEYADSMVFSIGGCGVKCPCCAQRDRVYLNRASFVAHCKTKTHQTWLAQLNANRANYYMENERLKKLVQSQRLTIAKYEKDLNTRNLTIGYLTHQLMLKDCGGGSSSGGSSGNREPELNLIDFN